MVSLWIPCFTGMASLVSVLRILQFYQQIVVPPGLGRLGLLDPLQRRKGLPNFHYHHRQW